MSEDYYKILGVSRSATADEIRKAYTTKALKHHPDKSSSPNATKRFQEILSAYQFLNEKTKREDDDRCGNGGGDHGGSESYDGDAWHSSSYGYHEPQPIFINLWLSLEQIFDGCRLRRRVRCKFYPEFGGAPYTRHRYVPVDVPCGVVDGEEIWYPQAGPRAFNETPSDVVFVVRQCDHPLLERRGNHLFYRAEVRRCNFANNRRNHTIRVPLIEGGWETVSVSKDEVASNSVRVLYRKGMTFYDNPSRRGNLFVELQFSRRSSWRRTAYTDDDHEPYPPRW